MYTTGWVEPDDKWMMVKMVTIIPLSTTPNLLVGTQTNVYQDKYLPRKNTLTNVNRTCVFAPK